MDFEKWYKHQPGPITEAKGANILWDLAIQTDRKKTTKNNRPDIVVKYYKRKTCFLIDMAVPSDNNISVKESNKFIQRRVNHKDWKNVAP